MSLRSISLIALAAVSVATGITPAMADYVAVRIEAENFTSRDIDWTLINASQQGNDPVDPYHSNASGDAYMELLPDTRVTHDDEVISGQNFWGGPAQGPALHYNVNVPQAGRYLVYGKAYSTGTEDNGIHVGVNSLVPESGQRHQWCEGKHSWTWSSAQRTEEQHCGEPKTIYIDFPASGPNTVTFWAREDGFELDQFILLKETHDGSLDCYPTADDNIRCDDAVTGEMQSEIYLPVTVLDSGNDIPVPEDSDGKVDLALSVSTSAESTSPGYSVPFTVSVSNNDIAELASNVSVTLSFSGDMMFIDSDQCILYDQTALCSLGAIAAGQTATANFNATTRTTTTHYVYASVSNAEPDPRVSNNSAQDSIVSNAPEFALDAALSLSANGNLASSGGIHYRAQISNLGSAQISGAQLIIPVDGGSSVSANGVSCVISENVCALPIEDIATASQTDMAFIVQRGTETGYNQSVEVRLEGDQQIGNNSASHRVEVAIASLSAMADGVISIEAETFSAQSPASNSPASGYDTPAWSLYSSAANPDSNSDSTHTAAVSSASASAFVRVLPDARASASDPIVDGVSNFDIAGTGPTMDYQVYFPTAGSYYPFVRMLATDSQDASVHIGLNNNWPNALSQVSVCAPNGDWQWASAQGAACSSAAAAAIEVPSAGIHTLQIAASTDGSSIDKIVISQNPAYAAVGTGPAATAYSVGSADLELTMQLDRSSYEPSEVATLSITVSNLAVEDSADAIVVDIDGIDPLLADSITGFDDCQASATGASCSIASLDAGQSITATLAMQSDEVIELEISADLQSLAVDDNTENDTASAKLVVEEGGIGSFSPPVVWLGWLMAIVAVRRRSLA